MDYDLIIVGSGSVGSAAGYYATRSGLKVLMIDSAMPPHQAGSHHGETRLIRHAYGEGSRYVPMLLRAQTLWDELAELSSDKIFHRSGVLNIGPENSEFISNVKNSAETYNLVIQSLSAAEIREKWPLFTLQDGYCGVYEPNSGFLQSEMAVAAYIRLAREAGCAQLFNCPVESINWLDDGIEVSTIDGVYRGAKLVVTAGTWVTKILPELPVKPLRKVFAWFHADGRYSEENHFPAFTLETLQGDQYYGFPSVKDELKLGKHNGGQWITEPEQRKPYGSVSQDGTESFNFFRHFLPGVGVSLRGASCTYDMTTDEDFIIDTLPDCDRLMVISGLSGHGFKFASVLGEIAALFAEDKTLPIDISAFTLKRFK